MKITKFLSFFPGFYLQTFDDKGKDKALTKHGPPGQFKPGELNELNNKGAGIFFTPNKFSKSRKANLCEGVNAWFFEIDNLSLDEQWDKVCNSPLMPSFVVKTKKSLHCYFLAKDGSIENFKRVQQGLIQYFDADSACKDISRVLRVPGFTHNKQEPVLVEFVTNNSKAIYTEQQMMEAFPYSEKKQKTVEKKNIVEGMGFWDAVSQLDNKTVLSRLSGKPAANFDTIGFRTRTSGGEYIDVNGKPADAWIDETGMIGSGKGGGPTFVQWLEFYGWSKGDIAKWIKENCQDLLPKSALKNQETTGKEVTIASSEDKIDKLLDLNMDFTWGCRTLDAEFSPLGHGKYIILVGETGVGKTAFAFHFAKENAALGHKVLYLSLEMSNEALLIRYARARMGIGKMDWKTKNFSRPDLKKYIKELPEKLLFQEMNLNDGDVNLKFIEKLITEGGYDMVFIDNFGFIDAPGKSTNEKVKKISRAMVNLKNKINVTIVALHHFRKGGEKPQKIRGMDAILGSGKIGHDVDFAIQVFRDLDMDEHASSESKSELAVFLMKDRDFGEISCQTVYYSRGEFHPVFVPEKY